MALQIADHRRARRPSRRSMSRSVSASPAGSNRRVRRPAAAPFGRVRRRNGRHAGRFRHGVQGFRGPRRDVASTLATATASASVPTIVGAGHPGHTRRNGARTPRRPRRAAAAPPPRQPRPDRDAMQALCRRRDPRRGRARRDGTSVRLTIVRSRSSHQPLSSSICRTARCWRRRFAVDRRKSATSTHRWLQYDTSRPAATATAEARRRSASRPRRPASRSGCRARPAVSLGPLDEAPHPSPQPRERLDEMQPCDGEAIDEHGCVARECEPIGGSRTTSECRAVEQRI